MKNSIIDYKDFSLSKINEPKYRHLSYIIAWPIYFNCHLLTECLIPEEVCTPGYCFIDDLVPFCEYFVIAYCGWYFLVAGTLFYFLRHNTDSFKKLMRFIIITQISAMLIYVLFPNRQDLRPVEFVRNNVFTDCVKALYSLDTNTNVCPSLHVSFSLAVASVWIKEKSVSGIFKTGIVVFCLIVCASVAFIKQHSVVDILVALPICILAEFVTYRKYYLHTYK